MDERKTTALHLLVPKSVEDGNEGYDGRQNFITLVQRFINAGLDKEQQGEQGNTPIFGYVALCPTYDNDYDEANDLVQSS